MRVSRALEAGTVWINDYLESGAGNPFGGYKKSGIGREIHKMAIEWYTNIKNIYFSSDESVPAAF
jgi:acyl-CoA reductase-like NAD-dependent aldehyde dehydrogenase